MPKLHVITKKSFKEFPKERLPLLEKASLEWAKENHKVAHKCTIEVQDGPKARYFKYLLRLLELQLESLGDVDLKSTLSSEIVSSLEIESLSKPRHLSCTQISMYEHCPRKWYYRYALGIKTPKTAALHFGTAADEALNVFFEKKIAGKTPKNEEIYEVFNHHWEMDLEKVNWKEDSPEALKKVAPKVIDAYIDKFDSITEATDVQTECRVNLDNGCVLLGYIDILEANAIVDTKTASKKWKESGRYAKHINELQPKAYSLWFLEQFERMPKEFRYQIVTKSDPPETQLISFQVKKFEVEAFRRRAQSIWNEIHEKLKLGKSAFPAQAEEGDEPGRGLGKKLPSVLCCVEWCDYAPMCKKEGFKVPLKWVKRIKNSPGHHIY